MGLRGLGDFVANDCGFLISPGFLACPTVDEWFYLPSTLSLCVFLWSEVKHIWWLTFVFGGIQRVLQGPGGWLLGGRTIQKAEKWCIIGDTNIVSRPEEKLGELRLIHPNEGKLEKSDRDIVSLEWSTAFPKAIGIIDVVVALDHTPIVLLL
ncbi:hypothetical protein V6N11_024515 [Hibiscus sabdariffa]|uniref:Uncharacterized protein n=1 Tax=Hibiscus sabdariffa TaxID=183260 RepID=A0ABR2QMB6_9ROSI